MKKKKFGRTMTGKNNKSPVYQVNTINALNATPLRPQSPMRDEDDPAAGVAIQDITKTQILRKARGLLQKKDNQTDNISKLQSKIGQLQRDAYDKVQVIDSMIKEYLQELEGKDAHKYEVIASMIKEHFQDLEGKYSRIQEMDQLHAIKLASKDIEFREMANKTIANRKKSNIVSVFISCCLYNVGT